MKRINFIINGKGILSGILDRKAKRLERSVSQAIDSFNDKADEWNEKAQSIIDSMGKCATAEDSSRLNGLINDYCSARENSDAFAKRAKYCSELQKELQKEVEVED